MWNQRDLNLGRVGGLTPQTLLSPSHWGLNILPLDLNASVLPMSCASS